MNSIETFALGFFVGLIFGFIATLVWAAIMAADNADENDKQERASQ